MQISTFIQQNMVSDIGYRQCMAVLSCKHHESESNMKLSDVALQGEQTCMSFALTSNKFVTTAVFLIHLAVI